MAAALRFLETAEVRRKVIVVGTISDYPGDASRRYRAVARQAATLADRPLSLTRRSLCFPLPAEAPGAVP